MALAQQNPTVVEICAGAGGQSLGLHQAGFEHVLAVEIDPDAAATLRNNLRAPVAVGDVTDRAVWNPSEYKHVDLFAGGVPCPPFSIAGRQLGSSDERDLFAWAVEQVGVLEPRAVMLENVRGLAGPRFAAYRQHVMHRLGEFGYAAAWQLITAADFGVPQLRPRFVLVAMRPDDWSYFDFPEPESPEPATVGDALAGLMGANGWPYAKHWQALAQGVAPTLVGGSKKHGGADLGPTRAKQAWSKLHVDGRGVADHAPGSDHPSPLVQHPRLTVEMAARVQGWTGGDEWNFAGRKTSQYRQVGNAFPPPVARAVASQIVAALRHSGEAQRAPQSLDAVHDPLYRTLVTADRPLSCAEISAQWDSEITVPFARALSDLSRDFVVRSSTSATGETLYELGEFRGFTGREHAAPRSHARRPPASAA